MIKLFILLVCLASTSWAACSREQTITNEGRRRCCYYDTKGIPTIGVGFNLQRSDAKSILSKFGLSLSDVLADCRLGTQKHCMTNSQMDSIFDAYEYPSATQCADSFAPGLSGQRRAAVADVAFAGCGTLNQFVNMKAALLKKDWATAAKELQNSKWCTQVKGRCTLDADCIRNG
uniref:Lysozyme n=1 Tax=Panagrolaimus davidi TaxID=227884 RepID=A0A914PMS8_9BILA